MVSLTQLWIPILLSAVGIFVASSLIHMVFKWHNAEYRKLANEDEVRAVVRASGAGPGLYVIPHVLDPKECGKPEVMAKFVEGPVGFLTLRPPGRMNMAAPLIQWFVLILAIAIVVAYVASRTVPSGASWLSVCRVVGLVAFMAYACGGPINAIWMGKPWSGAAKEVLDAFIYGLVTALIFAWLWPK